MAMHIGKECLRRRRGQVPSGRHLRRVSGTAALLILCSVVAGCGIPTSRFELAPRTVVHPTVAPLHVGVVVDKAFVPYRITFRYWSSTPFTWRLEGLPDALVETLSPYFLSVELISSATPEHDLIARMSVDRLHFDGANTTIGRDTVDLTMTLTVERPSGEEVFRTTVSRTASSEYSQPCAFCKPDPPPAFIEAFTAVFVQFAETLAGSGIRFVE